MAGKKEQKGSMVHRIIIMLLVAAALICGFGLFREYMESRRFRREYEKLAQMIKPEGKSEGKKAEKPGETAEDGDTAQQKDKEDYESPVDFERLSEINPDIVGWIRIPDTNINYPIVQSSDNDIYLHKSFQGEESAAGSIFLDFESQGNMRGYNNIIYGHNMKDGFMFRDVIRFKDQEYFKKHQYFEIYTPSETIHLKAVSCYYIKNTPEVRRTRFASGEAFEIFVQRMLEPCEYAEIPKETVDGLYTLVTCSYEADDGRTVLFAVEADGNS